jgi:hypothetical protein
MNELYRLEDAAFGEEWDRFVATSAEGSLFALSGYLRHVAAKPVLQWCYRRNERRAALLLIEDPAGGVGLHDFVVYSGLLFGPPTNKQNRAQRISEQHEIAEFVAAQLAARYPRVEFALSPATVDVRAFLWHNYGKPGPHYHASVRYTSTVDLKGFAGAAAPDTVPLFAEFSSARRQEIRYAIRDGVRTTGEFDAAAFVRFYAATMRRQDIEVPAPTLAAMTRLIEGSHGEGLGRMYVSRTAAGDVGSMAYIGLDARRAYYVFGANDPALRDSHTGSAVLWDAFRMLADEGVAELDLEGVNSPRRGWFKLSFGGTLLPYYEVRLEPGT